MKILKPDVQLIGLDYGIYIAEKIGMLLPPDVDCVIGIPRSGLLFANIIAVKRGWPLSTPDLFPTVVWQTKEKIVAGFKKIVIVEDSTWTGAQLHTAKLLIKQKTPDVTILTVSLFASSQSHYLSDFVGSRYPSHKFTAFEWNLAHASYKEWGDLCVDLDGVICRGNDPYIIPNCEIRAIITSRPETERETTERWLADHKVRYKELKMSSSSNQGILDISVSHKVREIKKISPLWFWESDGREARLIAKRTRIPVLCIDEMKIYKQH